VLVTLEETRFFAQKIEARFLLDTTLSILCVDLNRFSFNTETTN
jgi:hypothetical protein